MFRLELKDLARDTISLPVKYDEDGQMIFDNKNNLVCDMRGWGRIQYMDIPEERQDNLGRMIALAINEYLSD